MKLLFACALLSGVLTAQDEEPAPLPIPLPGSVPVPEQLAEAFEQRSPRNSKTERASQKFELWLASVKSALKSLARGEESEDSAQLDGVLCTRLRVGEETAEGSFTQGEVAGARWLRGALTSYIEPESGLADELTLLVEPFVPGELRIKTKVTSVHLFGEKVLSVQGRDEIVREWGDFGVRLELFGTNDEGPVQIIQHWTVEFELGEFEKARRIWLVDSEEVQGAVPSFFEDVTVSAFAETESFTEQFLPSLDHWTGNVDQSLGMSLLGHEGLALGDVDGDGLEDLYVLQPGGLPNRLYLHQPDHTLRDVSASAGVDFLDLSHSALFVDLDGDGDRDLAAAIAEELLLFSNEGDWSSEKGGRFELRQVLPGLSFFSLSAADFDGDGDLDLYGCAYSLPYWEDSIPIPYHDANNGRPNSLYRNEGEWRFSDATSEVGLDQNNSRYSFAAAWEDYDQDGDPDLYIANDFGRNNLYRNEGGRFRDVAGEAGVEDISAGMGVDWADVDGDGWMDLLVSNMYSSAGGRIAYQRNFHPDASEEMRALYQRHARGNSLFRNRGDGTFEDISQEAGIAMGRWAWGAVFGDWNSDGASDVFVPNGFVSGDDDDDL